MRATSHPWLRHRQRGETACKARSSTPAGLAPGVDSGPGHHSRRGSRALGAATRHSGRREAHRGLCVSLAAKAQLQTGVGRFPHGVDHQSGGGVQGQRGKGRSQRPGPAEQDLDPGGGGGARDQEQEAAGPESRAGASPRSAAVCHTVLSSRGAGIGAGGSGGGGAELKRSCPRDPVSPPVPLTSTPQLSLLHKQKALVPLRRERTFISCYSLVTRVWRAEISCRPQAAPAQHMVPELTSN